MNTKNAGDRTAGAQKRWSYGDAGDRWPVKFGEIWQVGPHILACGDLEQGHASEMFRRFAEDASSGLCVVDPPWNQGNASLFRTKASTWISQASRPVDFASLLDRVVEAARLCGLGFIEMGTASTPALKLAIQKTSGQVIGEWPITYYKKHPCRLVAASWRPEAATLTEDFSGLDDMVAPGRVIERFSSSGDLVFDPCFGRGLVTCVAHPLNRRFLGLELNPRRMAVTIDRLARYGLTPKLIGTLNSSSPK